ncbi:helix-turn-helix transcriptional regulator [Zoogloea sp.]|uniref:helix-turn-helix transcriptional regulator n=1 Tax=Zoogloea sp. TaxID=49181 RepID=UPI0035B444FF
MSRLKEVSQTSLVNFDELPNSANVRLPVMLSLYACSRATLYRLIKKGVIPQPRRLGDRASVWQVGEVRQSLWNLQNGAANTSK